MLEAKHKIAMAWKSVQRPSSQSWLEGLLQCIAMEKLTYIVKGKHHVFLKMWGSFMEFLEGDNFTGTL